jgi:hypothetical protein
MSQMKTLIESISKNIAALKGSNLTIEELDFLVEQTSLLHERLVILRYKVYEQKESIDVPLKEVVEAKEVEETSFPVESDNKDKFAEQKPFDFSLFEEEEEALLESEPEKTIEEHYSETTILDEENGIIEETTIKEHSATVEEGDSIIMINKEVTTTIAFSSAEEANIGDDIIASDHPLIAQFRALEKNARIERAIVPIDSLIGSFSLTEKLQFINGLFGGSSEAFASATKQLNDQPNMTAAILELITIAETNSWDFARSAETIDEFMAKLCRRYANSPSF